MPPVPRRPAATGWAEMFDVVDFKASPVLPMRAAPSKPEALLKCKGLPPPPVIIPWVPAAYDPEQKSFFRSARV